MICSPPNFRKGALKMLSLAFGLILAGSGCQDSNSLTSSSDMQFEVKEELLAAPFESRALSFSVRPPKQWSPSTDSALQLVQLGLDSLLHYPYTLLQNYEATDEGANLTIGYCPELSPERLDSIRASLELIAFQDGEQVQVSNFSINGLPVTQLFAQGPVAIQFRLFVPTGRGEAVQLDYFIPKSMYTENTAKLLESSIGSIKGL